MYVQCMYTGVHCTVQASYNNSSYYNNSFICVGLATYLKMVEIMHVEFMTHVIQVSI